MRYSLDEMDTFLAVMELGTVTAAAARLNLSKSVVSKRISDLEANLGAALFLRNAGRITPTDTALRLAEGLRPALAGLRAAAEGAIVEARGSTRLRGRLSISVPMTLGRLYLGPILARFAQAHPELDLLIDYEDRARDLIHDRLDAAVRVGRMRDTALMSRKICEDRQIACASPDYIARHGAPRDLADLRNHRTIGYSHVADGRMWQPGNGADRVNVPIASRITTNNGEAIRDFVLAGLGLGTMPGFICLPDIRAGRLVRVLPELDHRPLPIAVVWPPVNPMPMKLRALIDCLLAELGGTPPWERSQNGDSDRFPFRPEK